MYKKTIKWTKAVQNPAQIKGGAQTVDDIDRTQPDKISKANG